MTYRPPVDDLLTAMTSASGLPSLMTAGLIADLDDDTIRSVLEEAGKFASEVLAPLNRIGDEQGSTAKDGVVTTPDGWIEAYKQFSESGWSALPCAPEFGGQGLPQTVAMAVSEMWGAANMSFGLAPLLTQGAINAITARGSDELKAKYLPKMVSGEWTGTMNLTEPHAGSDVGALRTRAEPQPDGTYRIFGTKIFISYGEHDLTENIIHLVLARLPDAPAGTSGISLFAVPKFLVNDDGSLGARNDVVCASVEEKLGIHASPTCVMAYGEKDGAIGYIVGEVNRGLQAMFIMMNEARLAVGVQGVSVAERATQAAVAFANERKQGRAIGEKRDGMTEIVNHADIRRTIMTMKAMTQAARAICLATAGSIDEATLGADDATRKVGHLRSALLTPIAKAYSTDAGCEVASLGVQIHGGMGFVEETGAAQYYRDARILPIYEGTNGIQAIDLVTRKVPLEGGAVVAAYIGELKDMVKEVRESNLPAFANTADLLDSSIAALENATAWIGTTLSSEPNTALAVATPYLRLFGETAGGCYLARAALHTSRQDNPARTDRQIAIARFFAENICVGAQGLAATVTSGAASVLALSPEELSA